METDDSLGTGTTTSRDKPRHATNCDKLRPVATNSVVCNRKKTLMYST